MALVTANDLPVLTLSLVTPRIGAWHADVYVDSLVPLAGAVTLNIGEGAFVLTGTVAPGRSGDFLDINQLRVVGGAGGLGLTAKPKRYRSASVGIVFRALLADAGEVIDPTSDASVLAKQVADFTVRAAPVGAAIADLISAYAPGVAWRVMPSGLVWIGNETWPAAVVPVDAVAVLDNDDETRSVKIMLTQPIPLVATQFGDEESIGASGHVSLVQFFVSGADARPVEAQLWFEPAAGAGDGDRLQAVIRAIVRATPPGLDPRTWFWATVVQQSGDRIHAMPEDSGLPDMGDVALLMPPGDTVDGVTGGKVLVGFAGRQRTAVAHGFQGATPARRTIDAAALFLGGSAATPAPLGAPLITYLTNIAAAINAIAPGSVLPPAPAVLLSKKTNVA